MLGLSFDHGREPAQRNVLAGGLLAQNANTLQPGPLIVIKVPAITIAPSPVVNLQQIGAEEDQFETEQGKQDSYG